ncbi:MAG: hypothetical protein ACLR52_00830 [Veillonella atypica]
MVTVLGTVGCMNHSSNSSNDILKVGAISFVGTLEPTENYLVGLLYDMVLVKH